MSDYQIITPQPTLAGFTSWIYAVAGVPTAWLPTTSPSIGYAFNTAYSIVNVNFMCVPGPLFLQAVYNLAMHLLACWAQDPAWTPQPITGGGPNGSPPEPWIVVNGVSYGYWQYLRQQNNIQGFITGIVSSSGDEGSSVGLVVPKQAENLTLSQLQLTTTFWGRWYLGIAQSYGTNWGMS